MNALTEPTLRVWPPDAGVDGTRFLARQFGVARADLDIDFAVKPRATVVTALLAACLRDSGGRTFDADALWQWSVAARLQGLLAIVHETSGPLTTAVATCRHAGCGERIELELALADFALDPPDSIDWQTPQRQAARVRLPAGSDQLAWYHAHRAGHGADSVWLARRLIARLDAVQPAAEWQMPLSWVASIGTALAEADPLTALTVTVLCPACGVELAVEVDLEALLLESCRRQQRALLDDIHYLAGAYHWSETDIVALPAWRRARYLSRIQAAS